MFNVLIVMDSFKGSLSSIEAGNAVKKAVVKLGYNAEVFPFADGGEGTMEAIMGNNARIIKTSIVYPDGSEGPSEFAVLSDGTVLIESAKAVGLTLIPEEKRNPMVLSSVGLGQLIMHAYDNGYHKFLVALGGSGTNDGGAGMISSMGIKFTDSHGRDIRPIPKDMANLSGIEVPDDFTNMVNSCDFTVAADVNNPLCYENGASRVFGPQKGLKEQDIQDADDIMASYGLMSDFILHTNNFEYPGSGAAGGLGFAFLSYLNAKIISGSKAVIEMTGLERRIQEADLIITGEGKIDSQTLMGKGIGVIRNIADKYNKRMIAFGGSVCDMDMLRENGIEAYSIDPGGQTIEQLMDNVQASINLENKVFQVMSSLNLAR